MSDLALGTKPPSSISEDEKLKLRQAFGQFATGVTIITTVDEGGQWVGLTANSLSSVSLSPPLLLWSLANHARSLPVFQNQQHFAVHVLTAEQEALSNRFATKHDNKFEGLDIEQGLGDVPLLKDYAAKFECQAIQSIKAGDHTIFIGEILNFASNNKEPLLFHGGAYKRLVSF